MMFLFLCFMVGSISGAVSDFKIISPHDKSIKADFLVITQDSFIMPALPLLEHRLTCQREDVQYPKIIAMSTIIDSFTGYQYSYRSIHALMRYAYANWATPPKYLLLLGTAKLRDRREQHGAIVPFFPEPASSIYKNWDSLWTSKVTGSITFNTLDTIIDYVHSPLDYLYAYDTIFPDTLMKRSFSFGIHTPKSYVSRVPAKSIKDVENFVSNTIKWDTSMVSDKSQIHSIYENETSYYRPDDIMYQIIKFGENTKKIINKQMVNRKTFLGHLENGDIDTNYYYPKNILRQIDSILSIPLGISAFVGRGESDAVFTEYIIKYPYDTNRTQSFNHPFVMLGAGVNKFGRSTPGVYGRSQFTVDDVRNTVNAELLLKDGGSSGSIGTYTEVYATEYSQLFPNIYRQLSSSQEKSIAENLYVACKQSGTGMFSNEKYSFQGDPSIRYLSKQGNIDSIIISSKNPFRFTLQTSAITVNSSVAQSVHVKLFVQPDTFTSIDYGEGKEVFKYSSGLVEITSWDSIFANISDACNHTYKINDSIASYANAISVSISSKYGDMLYAFEFDSVKHISNAENTLNNSMDSIMIYPNPFNPSINVTIPALVTLPAKYSLFNIKGELVHTVILSKRTTSLSYSTLPAGCYSATIVSGKKAWVRKIVLIK
ncbi:MAG: T9SS type A sorting domain-containing protein [Fibrobacteres bacterium]|nr:T9SS type A sorting domain-containing protein [Fibrobacterota bacterium]